MRKRAMKPMPSHHYTQCNMAIIFLKCLADALRQTTCMNCQNSRDMTRDAETFCSRFKDHITSSRKSRKEQRVTLNYFLAK